MVWSWDAWLRMSHKTLTKNPQMFGFFFGPGSTSVGQFFAPFPTYVSLGDHVGCVTCFLADFSTKDISHFLTWPKLMCPSLRPAGLLSFLYGRKGSPQWSTSPKTLSGVRHVHFDDGKPDRFLSFSDIFCRRLQQCGDGDEGDPFWAQGWKRSQFPTWDMDANMHNFVYWSFERVPCCERIVCVENKNQLEHVGTWNHYEWETSRCSSSFFHFQEMQISGRSTTWTLVSWLGWSVECEVITCISKPTVMIEISWYQLKSPISKAIFWIHTWMKDALCLEGSFTVRSWDGKS